MSGANTNQEKLGQPVGVYDRLVADKVKADRVSFINNCAMMLGDSDYYDGVFNGNGADKSTWVDIGRYGFEDSTKKNYILNKVFAELPTESGPLTIESIRQRSRAAREHGVLQETVVANNGVVISLDYAVNNPIDFGLSFTNLGEHIKTIGERLSAVPALKIKKSMAETIRARREQLVGRSDTVLLTNEAWNGVGAEDRAYLFASFGVDPDDTGREHETVYKTNQPGLSVGVKGNDLVLVIDMEEPARRNEHDFVHSITAREIITTLDNAGLKLHDDVINRVTEGMVGIGGYNDRYGNGYADITRLLAILVRDERTDQRMDRIFSEWDLTKVSSLGEGARGLGKPAKLVLEMVSDLAENANASTHSLRLSKRSIVSYACKDAELYYYTAITGEESDRVHAWEEGAFLYKDFGGKTAIATQTVTINGVAFPPGFLFRPVEDGFEPLRATAFCFSVDEAKDAFGKQFFENQKASPRLGELITKMRKQE